MAYLAILYPPRPGGQEIGKICIVDGQNVVFDMEDNKVGYWLGGDNFCDLDMNPVESEYTLLLKHK